MTASKDVFTVGIAGLTGKFSRLIAHFLLERPNVIIRGYARNPSKLSSWHRGNPRISIIQGGAYDQPAARTFAKGCDIVICGYLGEHELMTDGQQNLIDACAAEGVPRYMASDYSLDYTRLELGELFPKDPMIEVKGYLEGSVVEGVHVCIGAFMDTLFSGYFQVWDGKGKTLRFWGDENAIWEATSYKNAAEFVATVALDPKAVGVVKYLGDRKSMREIADTMNSVYGFRPRLENLGSLDELYKRMRELRDKNPDDPTSYMAMFYQYYCTNGQCYLGDFPELDNAKYPQVKREGFKEFFERIPADSLADAMINAAG